MVDLDDVEVDAGTQYASASDDEPEAATMSPLDMIKDIIEREPSTPKPPTLPTFKKTATGFPEHKKRTRVSTFKKQRQAVPESPATEAYEVYTKKAAPRNGFEDDVAAAPAKKETKEEEELRLIDEENTKRLAAMSVSQIESERNELLSSLDPSLVKLFMNRANKASDAPSQPPPAATNSKAPAPRIENDIEKYLKSANLDAGRGDTGIEDLGPIEDHKPEEHKPEPKPTPIPKPRGKLTQPTKSVRWLEENEVDNDEDPLPEVKLSSLQPASDFRPHKHDHEHANCDDASHDHSHDLDGPTVHFPTPKPAPDLDPTDPNFLENLHSTYFPNLSADPSKLAWMAPLPTEGSPADLESSYNPNHPALPASALRFDFRGALLPPSISRAMPVTKGLHHHGDAPEAAGYTVPELARLARSTYPAQRCLAFQVLGRVMFRLGKGIFGQGSEMTMGLWRCVEEGKVIEILQQAAGNDGGHRSVAAYAQEAVWLWQRGGGKVMGAI